MLKNYIKSVLRNIFKNKILSFIKIIGLSVGLACGIFVIIFVKDEVCYDRFNVKLDHIYRVTTNYWNVKSNNMQLEGFTSTPVGVEFKKEVPEVEGFTRLINGGGNIRKGNTDIEENWLYVDNDFLKIFSFPTLYGNPLVALNNPSSIVLTDGEAIKYFGNANAIGQELQVNLSGKYQNFTVTAIVKSPPKNSSIQFDILLPFSVFLKLNPLMEFNWNDINTNTFVLLQNNANSHVIESKLNDVYKGISHSWQVKDNTTIQTFGLQPLKDIHLYSRFVTGNGIVNSSHPAISYVLGFLALFIILISSINFINLSIAQSMKRAKEIGVRKVNGATRIQLIIQFLSESFILTLLAGVFATMVAMSFLPIFSNLFNKDIQISYFTDYKVLLAILGLIVLTSTIAGMYPAFILSGFNPVKVLSARLGISGKHNFGKTLVVLQFVICTFLIMFTVTIFYQYFYLQKSNIGFKPNNLVRMPLYENPDSKLALYKQELSLNHNIVGVTGQSDGIIMSQASINGKNIDCQETKIDDDFLKVFQIKLIEGRNFSSPADSANSVIVNEEFVAQANLQQPIGKMISLANRPNKRYQIVGIVRNYTIRSLREPISPLVLNKFQNEAYNSIWIRISPDNFNQSINLLGATFKKQEPTRAFEFQFMSQVLNSRYSDEVHLQKLLSFIAVLTILLSCSGLFGLVMLSIEQRGKEISIRKIIGAPVLGIVSLLNKNLLMLIMISLLIALPLAYLACNKYLQSYARRITVDWRIFLTTSSFIILITILTISYHSLKIALSKPTKFLNKD